MRSGSLAMEATPVRIIDGFGKSGAGGRAGSPLRTSHPAAPRKRTSMGASEWPQQGTLTLPLEKVESGRRFRHPEDSRTAAQSETTHRPWLKPRTPEPAPRSARVGRRADVRHPFQEGLEEQSRHR